MLVYGSSIGVLQVVYGTADGKVGLVSLGREGPETGWVIEREGGHAGVQVSNTL